MIRNISQSSQEREIVKTAPDMVVYIEGLPFLINPYLKQKDSDLVAVNFNDYITSIQTSYSIDSMIPTGTINLSVPNGFKHLFMAPGGNTVFQVMASIRIYAKCYFFSERGNTVYRRIFNGLIKGLDFNENPMGLEIQLQIAGIMRLMEISQIETQPALVSNSSLRAQVFRSNQGNMSIYRAIYDSFDRALDFSEFLRTAFRETRVQDDVHAKGEMGKMLSQEYIVKWTLRLNDLRRDVRLFGAKEFKELRDPITDAKSAEAERRKGDPATQTAAAPDKESATGISDEQNKLLLDLLKGYHFDMSIGGIQLFGSQLTSKLERIRHLIDIAGFEGYQDIDGLIIIKPPLYNLDCTVLGDNSESLLDENLNEATNPYIINMAEVLSESYNEDENSIRRTSMTLTPNWNNPGGLQINEGATVIGSVVRYVDINLIRQFGVRDETPKYMGFLTRDTLANYGFAICELNKVNRNYRTYHVTIPMRPELRLGYPIYIPHKDMYAYVVAASITYNIGGQATMSLTCNYIRKRPLFRQIQTVTDEQGKQQDVLIYASQKNLIHAWVNKSNNPGEGIFNATGKPLNGKQLELAGSPSTLSPTPDKAPSPNQQAIIDYSRKKIGNVFETWVENFQGATWRIQKDEGFKLVHEKGDNIEAGGPPWFDGKMDESGKKTSVPVDNAYLRRLSMIQPYTDEKGYEVIPALPWGRYYSLRQAIVDCTRNYWYKGSTTEKDQLQVELKKANSFLMSGLALPNVGASGKLQKVNSENKQDYAAPFEKFDKGNVISFELEYQDNSDYGKSEQDFAADSSKRSTPDLSIADYNPSFNPTDPGTSTSNLVDKVSTFLSGYINTQTSSNSGPYAVSLLPQTTELGGYRPQEGPFSGLLTSINATFTSSPYGDVFGMRPAQNTTSAYFTSGFESQGNSFNSGAATYTYTTVSFGAKK